MKTCTKCGETKAREMFSKHATGRDGLQSHCKACVAAYGRAWAAANRERSRETTRAWREANADRKCKCQRAWKKANPHLVNASHARRHAAKLQRTQPWADLRFISRVYGVASLASKCFGPHHVDHLVPLQGKAVSGLHVHCNLRVIPAGENVRKHARFDEALALDRGALARSLGALILRANAALEVL